MNRTLILIFALFFTFSACDTNPEKDNKKNINDTYFNLSSLIETQLSYLLKENPQIKKEIHLNNKNESKIIKDVDWKKELDLFKEADINKPNLKGAYKILEENKGNMYYTSYSANDSSLKTQRLVIKKENQQVLEINILIKDSNELFSNERELKLKFKKNLLMQYEIKGFQKIAFNDPINYLISTTIL